MKTAQLNTEFLKLSSPTETDFKISSTENNQMVSNLQHKPTKFGQTAVKRQSG